jgi:hypothetical protein
MSGPNRDFVLFADDLTSGCKTTLFARGKGGTYLFKNLGIVPDFAAGLKYGCRVARNGPSLAPSNPWRKLRSIPNGPRPFPFGAGDPCGERGRMTFAFALAARSSKLEIDFIFAGSVAQA